MYLGRPEEGESEDSEESQMQHVIVRARAVKSGRDRFNTRS
jgi:hypothetical protein